LSVYYYYLLLLLPWMLAFGRLPRGPLSILRDIWIGDEELPFDVGKGIAEN